MLNRAYNMCFECCLEVHNMFVWIYVVFVYLTFM